jgi:SAM-dependent methyltransferase
MTTPPLFKQCALCGNSDFDMLFYSEEAKGTIVRCRKDGLVFLGDAPPEARLSSKRDIQGSEWKAAWARYRLERDAKSATFRSRLAYLPTPKPGHDRLLEVGCAAGYFLQVASEAGWQAIGLEPTVNYVNYARQELGQNVVLGILGDGDFREHSFDAVCLFHVFEHLPEPRLGLAEIRRVIKPGGTLVIEVPNVDNWWFRLLGKNWRQFQIGHHYYYSPKTLTSLLNKTAFEVNLIESVGKRMSLDYAASRVSRYSAGFARVMAGLFHRLRISQVEININMSDILLAVASAQ